MNPAWFAEELWQAISLTLRLAAVTTLLLLALSIPLAGWLERTRWRGVALVEALVTLPIVLPPTVIGFYLLVAFGNQGLLGQAWRAVFGQTLAFSFPGLVLGSVIYSLPFAVQPIQTALRDVEAALIESASALGAKPSTVFLRIMLPAARGGVFGGAALAFAHTVGEFGVVLMLGGNIPGVTRVASIALYDATQRLDYGVAHRYALVLIALSLGMLLLIAALRGRRDNRLKLR